MGPSQLWPGHSLCLGCSEVTSLGAFQIPQQGWVPPTQIFSPRSSVPCPLSKGPPTASLWYVHPVSVLASSTRREGPCEPGLGPTTVSACAKHNQQVLK